MNAKKAKFCKDDARHAIVEDRVYPVLFTENIRDGFYSENIENRNQYPTLWANGFRADLNYQNAAIFADYVEPWRWEIKSLRAISQIEVFRAIECRVGEIIAPLEEEM